LVVGSFIAMVAKCFIVGCTSGYKSHTEKVSQFSAPKDKNIGLRQRWQKSRKFFVVNDKTYVCSKHISQEDTALHDTADFLQREGNWGESC